MYKYFVLLIFIICFFTNSSPSLYENTEVKNYTNIENSENIQDDIVNKYFFDATTNLLESIATNENPDEEPIDNTRYINSWIESETVNITINKLKRISNGEIYKLKIILPSNFLSYLNSERLNIYFYVTENEIYRIWPYILTDGGKISFYDDDDMLLKILDTKEKLIKNGYIVFQENEYSFFETNIQDEKDEYESPLHGSHYSVEKNKKQTIGKYHYIKYNGERDFYEWFVWEEDKGLVEYGSGYRNQANVLYLKNISIKGE